MKGDSGLNFHYNREKRLEHAPEAVRKAYEVGNAPPRGFFRGLTANTGLRSVFLIIVLLFGTIFFLTFFGESANSISIDNLQIQLKAFLYEDMVYITVKCNGNDPASSGFGPVSLTVSGIDEQSSTVFIKELSGTFSGEELVMRTTMPDYEIKTVSVAVNFNKKDANVSVTVDRK